MTTISNFNKANLPSIRKELNALVKEYGQKIGVDFDFGNITFTGSEFKVRMQAQISGSTVVSERKDSILAIQMDMNGLQTQGIGGRVLTGYNSRRYAYPFSYTQDGKNFKCSLISAKMYFSK